MTHKANSETGIPLDILGIEPKDYSTADWLRMALLCPIRFLTNWQPYHKYIVEMGIDSPTLPKNMAYLLTIIRPRTAIFLNALATHTEFFPGGVDQIAREKGRLIESLPKNGLAILNADDTKVISYKNRAKAVVMTFGKNGKDVRINDWQVDNHGTRFKFNQTDLELPGYILPNHFAMIFASALCIALDEDYTLEEGCQLLQKHFKLEPGRSSVIEGISGSMIIDSSYNASAGPTIDMLELLAKVPGKRKLALLGDMRELGSQAKTEHERVVAEALTVCEEIFLVGPLMKKYGLPIETGKPVHWYENSRLAGGAIKPLLKTGDILLVKGSQNTIFLESAVEALMANPEEAEKLLCRRGEFWEKQRRIGVCGY
jgi:UDP-N-acetylmuramoyl-tripeptide--D-alanyl-D-alanine ligase